MKKAIVLCFLLLFACASSRYTNISQINTYFDQSGTFTIKEAVQNGDTVTYYFLSHTGALKGWYCWEYTCDKTGLILKIKDYWVGSDLAAEELLKHIRKL